MRNARLKPQDHLRPKLIAMSVAACFSVSATQVSANPTGGTVVSGNASFATSGNTLTITNTAGTIINWQSFSIGINEITRFLQSSSSSAVLNRVIGKDGVIPQSVIDGILSSNGRVFLLNSSGILIGSNARIDVAGFVASSLNLSDADFQAGRMRFTATPGAGKVSNAGTIDTSSSGPGGRVFLIGPDVENSGIIRTPQGQIVLAAGKTVELVSENSPFVTVNITADSEQALNVGQLLADSGSIGMFGALVRQGGVAQANSAVVGQNGEIKLVATKDLTLDAGSVTTANGPSGGTVTLQAQGGTNLIYGDVEAKGSSGQGGTIEALGVRVGVLGNGVIDASGDTGGGTVLVGGDQHGANPNIQNAQQTLIGPDGVIRADASTSGDGGRIVIWSDASTQIYGLVSAQGGAQAGNGGFIETSSKGDLDVNFGTVTTRAPNGQSGTWLLDPTNVYLEANTYAGGGDPLSYASSFATNPGDTHITEQTVENGFSANGTVRIQATNDVNFKTNLNLSYSSPGGLFEVRAINNINLAADGVAHTITTNGQNVTLSANDTGAVGVPPTLNTTTGTGSITGGGNIIANSGGGIGGNISLSGYGVNVGTLQTTGGLNVLGAPVGNITIVGLKGGVQTGNISTHGLDGTDFNAVGPTVPTSGRAGGSVSIDAAGGTLVTGNIDASGGRGGNGGASLTTVYAGQAGGAGGSVIIGSGSYGATIAITTGSISTYGGAGGAGANASPTAVGSADGGAGGQGGSVSAASSTGAITVGAINSSGASGGNGADSTISGYAGNGGTSGSGGSVSLTSLYGLVSASTILTSSGNSGNAGIATTGPAPGTPFVNQGGNVTISAGDTVTTGNITTSGGNGGSGANPGVAALGGAAGSVTINAVNALSTGAITSRGGAGATGTGAGGPFAGNAGVGGLINLNGSGVSTGAMDVSGGVPATITVTSNGDITTGALSAVALTPVNQGGGINLTTAYGQITVNGNIDVRGSDGSTTLIDTCGDGCFTFFYGGSTGGIVALQRNGNGAPASGVSVQVNGSIFASGGNGVSPSSNANGGTGGYGGQLGLTGDGANGIFYGAVNVTGAIDVHGGAGAAGAAGYAGGYGGNGGFVTLAGDSVAAGSINVSAGSGGDGGANGTAGSGYGGKGGVAGNAEFFANTTIAVGSIAAFGGNGGNGGSTTAINDTAGRGGDGGEGGIIIANTTTAVTASSVTLGAISATGGHGGNGGSSPAGYGGAGGNGGIGTFVTIDPTNANIGSITVSAGAGGNGGYGGIQGGAGGNAGGSTSVNITGNAAGGTIAVGNIDVSGANGGSGGGSAGLAGAGGAASSGGTINVNGSILDFTSGGTFTAAGGTGGQGGVGTAGLGAGGAGGNGGNLNLTAASQQILTVAGLSYGLTGGLGGATGGVNGVDGIATINGSFVQIGTGGAGGSLLLEGNTVTNAVNNAIQQTNNAPSTDDLQKKIDDDKKKNQVAVCK